MTPETLRMLAQIQRCAERQVDQLPPAGVVITYGTHVLWYLDTSPTGTAVSRLSASQRALISVKLG